MNIPRWTLFFEPLDVLLFRDHRPFDMGFHNVARSTFPLPTVFYGGVRTALFERAGADFTRGGSFGLPPAFNAFLGTATERGSLHLRGPFYARRSEDSAVEPVLPMPADCVVAEGQRRLLRPRAVVEQAHAPRCFSSRGGATSAIPWAGARVGKGDETEHFLSLAGARRYLSAVGDSVVFEEGMIVAKEQLVTDDEERVGIQRDPATLTADEGMFYVTRCLRFAYGWGLAVDVTIPEGDVASALVRRLHGAVVPLGGKGHRARVHVLERALVPDDLEPASVRTGARVKHWLVTPAVMPEAGWPVVTSVSRRAVQVGGFDLQQRAARPLRIAAPGGAVFFTQGVNDLVWAEGADLAAGFGVALRAPWTPFSSDETQVNDDA